jgi:hypothetical protein
MPDLFVRVGGAGRSNTVPFPSGWVQWYPPLDHMTVTSYEARVRAEGSGTVLASMSVGKPIPHSTTGLCYADISSILSGLTAGNYTTSIAATNAFGTTDSGVSDAFSLPLS